MILVTGARGVLGSALADQLARGGEPYRLLSSSDVDLRDRDATIALFAEIAPRLVFHLAARVHGLMGHSKFPADVYSDNIYINTNVIEAARRTACEKIVAAGTVAIYSSAVPAPVREESIWDGPPHASEAAYGHAKRAMLGQLEACARQHGLAFAYPIITNLYGPHDRFDPVHGHVVPSLVAKFHAAASRGEGVRVWGTGRAERDFMEASDAARALLLIGERGLGPINVATGATVQIRDVVQVLQRHSGVAEVEWDTAKPEGQMLRRYDIAKLQGYGFRPEVAFAEGLAATYDWYAANYPLVRS